MSSCLANKSTNAKHPHMTRHDTLLHCCRAQAGSLPTVAARGQEGALMPVQDAAADRCLDARRNRMDLHNSIPIRGWAFKLFAPAKVLAVVNG